MAKLKTVLLSGSLARRFGREHKLDVSSPREACRALSVLIPGFEEYLATAHLRKIRFAVFKGKRNIGVDELDHRSGEEVIRIIPVIEGRKAGLLQTIIGITLIVIGVYTGNPYLVTAGVSMTVGGVVQMLSPPPPNQKRQDAENAASYAFGGPVNTTAMGNPVPVAYGLRERGGAVISASILTNEVSVRIDRNASKGPGGSLLEKIVWRIDGGDPSHYANTGTVGSNL